jgi:hypothetical protein
MSAKGALIEFLAASRIDSRDGGVWDDGAIVYFFQAGTGFSKAVWLDRDKTLPTAAGIYQTTLGSDGSCTVFGDGVYDVKIYDSEDVGLTTPLKTFSSVSSADSSVTVGSDVSSATNLTLGSGNSFDVTGTTTITNIASKGVGETVVLQFDGSLILTHNGSNLTLPGGVNITTGAGDIGSFYEYDTGKWRCISFRRAASTGQVGIYTSFVPGGNFSTGTIYASRVGRIVNITFTALTHAGASGVAGSTGVIPIGYRPVATCQSVFDAETGYNSMVRVDTAGEFTVYYRDWAGTLSAQTACLPGTITYVAA